MPRPYSRDLREGRLRAEDAGLAADEIERSTGIGRRSLRRWRAKRTATGDLGPGRPTGRPRRIGAEHDRVLLAQAAQHPDWTLARHAAAFAEATGATVSTATVSRRFAAAGLTRKKSPRSPPSATRRAAKRGGTRSPPRIPRTSSSWTRRARRPP